MAKVTAALILILLLVSTGYMAFATPPEPMPDQEQEKFVMLRAPCAEWYKMDEMAKKHGEELLFIGQGLTFSAETGRPYRGGMAFYVNQEKGNWTMYQMYGDGIACMLFNGGDFTPYSGD